MMQILAGMLLVIGEVLVFGYVTCPEEKPTDVAWHAKPYRD